MELKHHKKYKVVLQCYQYSNNTDLNSADLREDLYFKIEEEYVIGFIFEKNNRVYVSLNLINNKLISPNSKPVSLELFKTCFEDCGNI